MCFAWLGNKNIKTYPEYFQQLWVRRENAPLSCWVPFSNSQLLFSKIILLIDSNVKTVKEQTFHKHSKSIPTSNGNETKTSEFVTESAPSKEHIFIWSWRADSGPTRQQDKVGTDTKVFWFRFQNDTGTIVLSFLTLLLIDCLFWSAKHWQSHDSPTRWI